MQQPGVLEMETEEWGETLQYFSNFLRVWYQFFFFFFLDDLCCLKKLKHLACSPSSIPKLSPPQRGIRQKQSLHCFTPHPNSHSICAQALCVTSNIPPCFSSVLDPHSCPAWSESEREDFQSGFPTPISCKTTFPIPFSLKISDFQRSV